MPKNPIDDPQPTAPSSDQQDERADARLRALLASCDEPAPVAPPPALAQAVQQRLPAVPPVVAARRHRQRRVLRQSGFVVVAVLLLLLCGLGAWGILGDSTAPAQLLGGVQMVPGFVLLTLVLLAKPIVHTLLGGGWVVLLGSVLAVGVLGWLWRWVWQRTPPMQLAGAGLAVLLLLPTPAHAQPTATEQIRVPLGQEYTGTIATFDQPIVIEGIVTGDVTSWVAPIRISGYVMGDVVSYGGSVVVDNTARVDGSILVLTGNIASTTGADIAGQVIGDSVEASSNLSAIGSFQDADLAVAPVDWLRYLLFSVIVVLLVVGLGIFETVLLPARTARASYTLAVVPWHAWGLGLLTTLLLATLLVPLLLLLAFSLVGLPMLVVVGVLLQLPFAYGLIVLAQAVVRLLLPGRIAPAASPPLPLTIAVTLVLLLPLIVLGARSLLAAMVPFYVLVAAGVGALLLSRGGALIPVTRHVPTPRP